MHAWLVEINANPSLNVYVDTPLPNGDIEQNLSEVDKYVKTTIVSDILRIVTMPKEELTKYTEIGCLKKVLPNRNDEDELEEMFLYSHFEKLFEHLSGNKNYDFITLPQFSKLQKIPGFLSPSLTKASYELIYKNVVLRSDSTQMDLNCFFEAIEEIAIRLFGSKDPYDNLMQVISMANNYVDLGI